MASSPIASISNAIVDAEFMKRHLHRLHSLHEFQTLLALIPNIICANVWTRCIQFALFTVTSYNLHAFALLLSTISSNSKEHLLIFPIYLSPLMNL